MLLLLLLLLSAGGGTFSDIFGVSALFCGKTGVWGFRVLYEVSGTRTALTLLLMLGKRPEEISKSPPIHTEQ